MAVSFDSVTLTNPEPYTFDFQVQTADTILLSGKHSIQTTSEVGFSVTFVCHTLTYADVTNLRAKIGSSGTLVTDDGTYTNCYISSFTQKQDPAGLYEYTVGFRRHTV
jgi:hypothetical protein